MALSNDFEARRRARLKEQRRKRERMNKIKRIVFILLCLLILIILIPNIIRGCSNGKSESNAPAKSVTTVTEAPEPTTEALNVTSIPSPKEGDNDFLDVLKNSGQIKKVYLTFEDGPDKTVTPEILDTLRRYNVKATFFVVGKNIESDSYLCTRMMEEGHLVLPLSYSGNLDTLYASKTDFMDQIDKTYDLICENSPTAAKPFKIYRFPGGSTSSRVTQAYKDELAANGYYYCDWNTSVGDDNSTRTADQLNTYFTTNMPNLNNLVVQLHNTSDNEATAQMLGTMIKNLLDDGYSFCRLDEVDFNNASDEYMDQINTTDSPEATESISATTAPAAAATKAPVAAATKAPTVKATTPPSTGGAGNSSNNVSSSASGSASASGSGTSGTNSNTNNTGSSTKGVIETE